MKIQNSLLFILISAILELISSKKEKFLSKLDSKSPNPISFLEESEEKKEESSNGINLEKFLNNHYYLGIPKALNKWKDDYELADPKDGKTVKFNFLKNTKHLSDSTVVKIDGNKTIRLSGKKDNKKSYINLLEKESGVKISFNQEGDLCDNNGKKHKTFLVLKCDCDVGNKNFLDTATFSSSEDSCDHEVELNFFFGCTITSGVQVYNFIRKYKTQTGFPLLVIGGVISILGAMYFKYVVFLISGIGLCYVTIPLILLFKPSWLSTDTNILICLIGSFILGGIIGGFLRKKAYFIVAIIGGLLGYSASSLVYSVVGLIYSSSYSKIICTLACIALGMFGTYKLSAYCTIIGTAAGGGYIAAIEAGEIFFPDLSKYILYLAWFLIAIIGLKIQWYNKDKIKNIFKD